MQAKVESLTTTNALMKEDLAIARNSLLALQAENQAMRQNSIASMLLNIIPFIIKRNIIIKKSQKFSKMSDPHLLIPIKVTTAPTIPKIMTKILSNH